MKHLLLSLFAVLALTGVLAPEVGFAQTPPPRQQTDTSVFPTGFWGPILSCSGKGADAGAPATTPVPGQPAPLPRCTSLCDLVNTAERVINFALTILIFVITPLMVLYGGILILTSAGSSEQIGKANAAFKYAAIGLLLGLAAFSIVTLIYSTITPKVAEQAKWYEFKCRLPESFKPLDQQTP